MVGSRGMESGFREIIVCHPSTLYESFRNNLLILRKDYRGHTGVLKKTVDLVSVPKIKVSKDLFSVRKLLSLSFNHCHCNGSPKDSTRESFLFNKGMYFIPRPRLLVLEPLTVV